MNRSAVLFHLREATEQLRETIQSLESNGEYCNAQFQVDVSHVYHHINTAWNGRNQTDAQHAKCTDDEFHGFRRFPDASELHLD